MQVLHKLSEMNIRHILKKIKQTIQEKEGTKVKKVRKFTTLNQQNVHTYSLDIYCKTTLNLLHVSICKGRSSKNQTKLTQHNTKLVGSVYS
jgi:hypothetical protein